MNPNNITNYVEMRPCTRSSLVCRNVRCSSILLTSLVETGHWHRHRHRNSTGTCTSTSGLSMSWWCLALLPASCLLLLACLLTLWSLDVCCTLPGHQCHRIYIDKQPRYDIVVRSLDTRVWGLGFVTMHVYVCAVCRICIQCEIVVVKEICFHFYFGKFFLCYHHFRVFLLGSNCLVCNYIYIKRNFRCILITIYLQTMYRVCPILYSFHKPKACTRKREGLINIPRWTA